MNMSSRPLSPVSGTGVSRFGRRLRTIGALGLVVPVWTLVFACLLTASASRAGAEEMTPEETVTQFVGRIKEAGSPWPIVDYINWDKAFAEFPAPQKEQLKLKDAGEMKNFFKAMLQEPAKKMKEQMEARIKEMPKEMQDKSKPMMSQLEDMMKKKEAEMKDRIAKTEYKVLESKVDGANATVKLQQKYNTEEKVEEIKLEKFGDKWLLPSIKMAQMQPPGAGPSTAPGAGAPATGAPAAAEGAAAK